LKLFTLTKIYFMKVEIIFKDTKIKVFL